MKSPFDAYKVIEKIQEVLNRTEVNLLARKTKFIQRQRNLEALSFVYLCCLSALEPDLSLEQCCISLEELGVRISKQALNKRFTQSAVTFMNGIVSKLIANQLLLEGSLSIAPQFKKIIVRDSTSFQLPESFARKYKGFGGGASPSGIKIHYQFDLKNSNNQTFELRHGVGTDVIHGLEQISKGDLLLADLGYFQLANFATISKIGAYFLSRLNFTTNVYCLINGKFVKIEWSKQIKKMKVGQVIDMKVYLGNQAKLPARLILEKVPKKLADKKREKLQTDKVCKRKNLSPARLEFCSLNAYITNASADQLPKQGIREYYGLRWQIEIKFKIWKSIYNIDKVPKSNLEKFECFTLGRFILFLLHENIFNYYKLKLWNQSGKELSEIKSYKALLNTSKKMLEQIQKGINYIEKYIRTIGDRLIYRCIKEQRKKKLNPYLVLKKYSLS